MLLLAKGAKLTTDLLERLRGRGVKELIVDAKYLPDVASPEPEEPEESPREPVPVAKNRKLPSGALIHSVTRPVGPRTEERERAAAARRDALAARVGELFARAELSFREPPATGSGRTGPASLRVCRGRIDANGLRDLSRQSIDDLCADFDLFTAVGLARPPAVENQPRDEWDDMLAVPPEALSQLRTHAVRTTHLALAIGTVAGLRKWELEHLAMGCLVHDAGMTLVDPSLWFTERRLEQAEFARVAEHPRFTLDLLRGVPAAARAVAVQIHERVDGSGYPYRLRGGRVHRLARLAAVADAYCGMTCDRPHRAAFSAHTAVRVLAAAAIRGQFDPPAVRAFLETVGVFPPGTAVVLSDGRCGRVIEADRNRPVAPRIELWDPFADRFTGEIVNLADPPGPVSAPPDRCVDEPAAAGRPRVIFEGAFDVPRLRPA